MLTGVSVSNLPCAKNSVGCQAVRLPILQVHSNTLEAKPALWSAPASALLWPFSQASQLGVPPLNQPKRWKENKPPICWNLAPYSASVSPTLLSRSSPPFLHPTYGCPQLHRKKAKALAGSRPLFPPAWEAALQTHCSPWHCRSKEKRGEWLWSSQWQRHSDNMKALLNYFGDTHKSPADMLKHANVQAA